MNKTPEERLMKYLEIRDKKVKMFDEMLEGYKELLADSQSYYHLFPNSFRQAMEDYYSQDIYIIARAEALKEGK